MHKARNHLTKSGTNGHTYVGVIVVSSATAELNQNCYKCVNINKKMSKRPDLISPKIAVGTNVVFEKISARKGSQYQDTLTNIQTPGPVSQHLS